MQFFSSCEYLEVVILYDKKRQTEICLLTINILKRYIIN